MAAGVPASKIMLGIPFYGHSWYKPDMSQAAWQGFGQNGTVPRLTQCPPSRCIQ
jgi:spore germination protein YaaH